MNKPFHVVFFVYLASCWGSYKSVCEALCADPDFKVTVFFAPYFIDNETLSYDPMLAEIAIPQNASILYGLGDTEKPIPLASLNADIIFMQTPFYNSYFPLSLGKQLGVDWCFEEIAKFSRLAYIPYGFYLANILDLQFNTPFHHATWRLFVESPLYVELYRHYGNIPKKNTPVCGTPKFDLYNEPVTQKFLDSFWKKPKTKHSFRILWTPHWSIVPPLKFSNFLEYLPFFQQFLLENPHVEILLKPHPLLFRTLVTEGIYTQKDIENLKKTWLALPNASLYEGGDYIPLFRSSDALVGDSISFLAEYLPTQKPLCFITRENEQRELFNPVGKHLVEAHYTASSQQEVKDFLHNTVCNHNDTKQEKRKLITEQLFVFPQEGAGNAIKNYCKHELRKEQIKKDLLLQRSHRS